MTTRSHNYAKLRFFPENQASPCRKTSAPECAGPVRRDDFLCDSLLFRSLRRRCSPVPIRRKTEVSGKMSSLGGVVRQDEKSACAMRDGGKRRRNCGMTEGKGKADCGTRCGRDERRGPGIGRGVQRLQPCSEKTCAHFGFPRPCCRGGGSDSFCRCRGDGCRRVRLCPDFPGGGPFGWNGERCVSDLRSGANAKRPPRRCVRNPNNG